MPFLKIFVTEFSGTMKARNLKVRIIMDNNWMCTGIGAKGS